MKRIINIVLVLAMLITLVPTSYASANLAENPGFEKDTSWWTFNTASVTRTDREAASGKYSGLVNILVGYGTMRTPKIMFDTHSTYSLSAKVKLAEGYGKRSARLVVEHTEGESWMTPAEINDETWTTLTGIFQCNANTNDVCPGQMFLRVGDGSETLKYYIDDVEIIASGNSLSSDKTQSAPGEMITNRGFDKNTDGWISDAGASVERIEGDGANRTKAFAKVNLTKNGYIGFPINVSKGQKYDMSAFVKTAGNAAFITLCVRHSDGSVEQVAVFSPGNREWNSIKGQYLHRRESELVTVCVTSNNINSFYVDDFSVIPNGNPVEFTKDEIIAEGETGIIINNAKTSVPVYQENGHLMVPVAEFAKAVGGTYHEENGVISIRKGINSAVFKADEMTMTHNALQKKLVLPASVINGQLCGVISDVATAFGANNVTEKATYAVVDMPNEIKFNNAAKKIIDNKKLTIGMLTASPAQRSGTWDPFEKPLDTMLYSWFSRNFADCDIKVIKDDQSSTGLVLGAFRAEKFVKDNDIDLLIVDLYRNDVNLSAEDTEKYAATLVREVKRADNTTDILFIYTATPELYELHKAGNVPAGYYAYEKVAEKYSIPTLDLCQAIVDEVRASGKTIDNYVNRVNDTNTASAEVYAGLITDKVKECLESADEKTVYEVVDEDKGFEAELVPATNAVLGSGWEKSDKNLSASKVEGYVKATTPGSELEYIFEGNVIGLYFESNPKSGDIIYSIDGGVYKSLTMFDEFSYKFEHMSATILAGNLSDGKHTLKIKVAASKNINSKSTLINLAGFMVGVK